MIVQRLIASLQESGADFVMTKESFQMSFRGSAFQ